MCKLHLEADPTCIDCAREITGLDENELAKADLDSEEDEEDEAERKAYDLNEARIKEEKHNI